MITVATQGGLGNQMFQYAIGLAQANRLQTNLRIDKGANQFNSFRPFNLDLFQIPEKVVENVCGKWCIERSLAYDEDINSKIVDGVSLLGYWQNERYFQSVTSTLRERFRSTKPWTPEALNFRDKIAKAGSAATFVGVRRTDYVTNPAAASFQGTMDLMYYLDALTQIRNRRDGEKPVLFVFSDDVWWVRENFFFPFETNYFEGDRTIPGHIGREDIDLGLMSLCNNAIIANSSFHWWGAWLGDKGRLSNNGYVVAPRRWFRDPVAQSQIQIVPDRWIKI